MNFIREQNRIYLTNASGKMTAQVTFPPAGAHTVEIDHTFVDDTLRGQGIAGQLMEEAARFLRETGRQAVPTCSYAVKWFEKHPEYADILKKESDPR